MADNFQIKFTPEAENDLRALDKMVRGRVISKISWLGRNFPRIVPEPLIGRWRDYFKLRVGDWRVIYQTDYLSKLIIIFRIERRDKVYKMG